MGNYKCGDVVFIRCDSRKKVQKINFVSMQLKNSLIWKTQKTVNADYVSD